jgi:hypothetical protein
MIQPRSPGILVNAGEGTYIGVEEKGGEIGKQFN